MVNTLESEIAKLTSLVAQLSQSLQARKKELDDDKSLGKGIRRNDGNNDSKNDARKVFDELSSIKIGTVREQLQDSNSEVYDVSDCLESEGIEIVSTKEENDVHQDSSVSDVSVVNKADKMEQKGEVGNRMIDISIGLMGIRVMNCDDKGVEDICEENVEGVGMELDATSCLGNIDKLCTKAGKGNELGSNESSDVEVNGVVIVDEPMKGEVKNKSEVIVDVSNGNFAICDTLFERKKTRPWNVRKVVKKKEIMKDSTDQTAFQSALLLNDPKTNWRGQDSSWNEDMESIGVISNNFKGIWEDSEKMIILLIHMVSGVKRGLSDSKEKGLSNLKCFIRSKGVTRSISDFEGKYLFMSCKDANKNGVNICYWELSGCKWRGRKKTCGIYCQVRNNKWKFDTWRWPKRKKVVIGCGLHQLVTLRDGNCEIIKLEGTLIRVVSSCWLLVWMGRLKFSEYMLFQTLELSLNLMFSIESEPSFQVWFIGRQQRLKRPFGKTMENIFDDFLHVIWVDGTLMFLVGKNSFKGDGMIQVTRVEDLSVHQLVYLITRLDIHQFVYLITLMNDMLCVSWLKGSFSGKDGYGFALLANKNVNGLYPLIMVEKSAEDSVWEETKVMDNVIKCFGKGIGVDKNQMVFKLLLEFASNIHRVHDINDTRLREIDAKFGDLGLEKMLKLVKKTYLGHDRRAHLAEVQPEPKCGPEPEREVELMVINKELLNYPSSRNSMKHYTTALSLLKQINLIGIPCDIYAMNISINCYCRLKQVNYGFALLLTIFKLGHPPDLATYSALINGLVLADRVFDAVELFKNLIRDKLCEGTVINGLYRMVDDALRLFNEMTEKGIHANVITYTSLIHGLCNFGRESEAARMLIDMEEKGVPPDARTYTTLVNTFCKQGSVKDAELVVQAMERRGLHPNVVTYNALIDGYCLRGEIDEARKVLDGMVERPGLIPYVITYNNMLQSLFQSGNPKAARELFNEMQAKGLTPSTITYRILFHGMCKSLECADALLLFRSLGGNEMMKDIAKELLKKMEDNGCVPDSITYRVIIQELLKKNECQDAENLLEEMMNRVPVKGASAYPGVIITTSQVSDALVLFRTLENSQLKKDVAMYNIMIDGCNKCGKLNLAMDLFDELLLKGLKPDVRTYTVMIRIYCQEELLKKNECRDAENILEEMMNRGFMPDYTTFSMLLDQIPNVGQESRIRTIIQNKLKSLEREEDCFVYAVGAYAGMLLSNFVIYNNIKTISKFCRLAKH
ncbi:putative tetratricopeptide-like helical domain-containing protein [Tanacetum coccineum]